MRLAAAFSASLVIISFFATLNSPAYGGTERLPSEDEIAEMLTNYWNSLPWCSEFPVGNKLTVDNNPFKDDGNWRAVNDENRYLSPKDYHRVKLAAEYGYLSIIGETEADLMKLAKSTISIRPSADKIDMYHDYNEFLERGMVCVKMGDAKVNKIISVQPIDDSLDQYFIARGLHSVEFSPFLSFMKAANDAKISDYKELKVGTERKFVALFKFDLFEGNWKPITWDISAANQDFDTDRVRGELRKAIGN